MITLLSALTGLLRLLAWLLGMITLLSALTTLLATLVLLVALVLVGTSHIGTPLVTIERRLTAPVAITFPIRRFFLFCLTACSCESERAREIANVACYSGLRLLSVLTRQNVCSWHEVGPTTRAGDVRYGTAHG
jgi:hypothetical protein